TVNFRASTLLAAFDPAAQEMPLKNMYVLAGERSYDLRDRMRRFESMEGGRNQVENHLFGYEPRLTIPQDPTDLRIRDSLRITSQHFAPEMRPIYGAVNFLGSTSGAAPAYGRSFVELRSRTKSTSTFLPDDSFVYGPTTAHDPVPLSYDWDYR